MTISSHHLHNFIFIKTIANWNQEKLLCDVKTSRSEAPSVVDSMVLRRSNFLEDTGAAVTGILPVLSHSILYVCVLLDSQLYNFLYAFGIFM